MFHETGRVACIIVVFVRRVSVLRDKPRYSSVVEQWYFPKSCSSSFSMRCFDHTERFWRDARETLWRACGSQ